MKAATQCPECGARWSSADECTDHFHQMLFWEWDEQLFDVHHLLVLCYHLQHPSLYSPQALGWAKHALARIMEDGATPQSMRRQSSRSLDSGARDYRITGTPGAAGRYEKPVHWDMRAADVVNAGIDNYYASVRQWAASIRKSLRESGNLS